MPRERRFKSRPNSMGQVIKFVQYPFDNGALSIYRPFEGSVDLTPGEARRLRRWLNSLDLGEDEA